MFFCFFMAAISCSLFDAVADAVADASVPTLQSINYGHLQSNVRRIRQREEQKLQTAMESFGFFVLTNHGLDHHIMDQAWTGAIEFFDSDESNKLSVPMTKDYIYGYQKNEILSRSEEASHDTDVECPMVLDDKETFQVYIGSLQSNRARDVQWPAYPAHMNHSWTLYYRELEQLADGLLQSIASVLQIPAGFFEQYNSDHMAALRAANYPATTANATGLIHRCSCHTDWTVLTILRQDTVGGLQVEHKATHQWLDIVTDPYDFVINLGDLMQRWSNNRFQSARHRVVDSVSSSEQKKITQRRQSMAFFYFVDGDTLIDVLPTCIGPNETVQYEPVKVYEYLRRKHSSATNIRYSAS